MSQTRNTGFHSAETRMSSFWLPPNASGNGLDADRWAEIILVSQAHAEQLLEAFRAAGIAARMAKSCHGIVGEQNTHVWVDPDRYGAAENVLLREMSR
jgi:hypothetical protein